MSVWAEALAELERLDFELARSAGVAEAGSWLEQRAHLLRRLAKLPIEEAGQADRVRLARADTRGRELQAKLQAMQTQIRAEAGDLYSTQLLLRALQPDPHSPHVSFES
ncbi:MAG: hypothetical protein ABI972_00465 [Acidobacteriota bacterium]